MRKIVVAATGASGSLYFKLLLDKLMVIRDQWEEIALVMSDNAKEVWETELQHKEYNRYDLPIYGRKDFSAPFASGSGQFDTMIIIPCSMGTMGRIANGMSNDLISRAADVILKERRKLICVIRDTPYNLVHIRNMETITLAGGIICPATPSFYSLPKTIDELASTVVDRVMDLSLLNIKSFRWGESDK
jgi:4-hydroxy-3-polyprenylbenzoate decarboxylase